MMRHFLRVFPMVLLLWSLTAASALGGVFIGSPTGDYRFQPTLPQIAVSGMAQAPQSFTVEVRNMNNIVISSAGVTVNGSGVQPWSCNCPAPVGGNGWPIGTLYIACYSGGQMISSQVSVECVR